MQIKFFIFRIVFWFYLVVFIAINKSTCFSFPPDQGTPTYFLHVPLFCAGTGIFDFSCWIIQNWD